MNNQELPPTDDKRLLELRHKWRRFHTYERYLAERFSDSDDEKEFLEQAEEGFGHPYVDEFEAFPDHPDSQELYKEHFRSGVSNELVWLVMLSIGVGAGAVFIWGLLYG